MGGIQICYTYLINLAGGSLRPNRKEENIYIYIIIFNKCCVLVHIFRNKILCYFRHLLFICFT